MNLLDMMTDDDFLQSAYVPQAEKEKKDAAFAIPGFGGGWQFDPVAYYGQAGQVGGGQQGVVAPGWASYGMPNDSLNNGSASGQDYTDFYNEMGDDVAFSGPSAVDLGWISQATADKIPHLAMMLMPPIVKAPYLALKAAGAFSQGVPTGMQGGIAAAQAAAHAHALNEIAAQNAMGVDVIGPSPSEGCGGWGMVGDLGGGWDAGLADAGLGGLGGFGEGFGYGGFGAGDYGGYGGGTEGIW